MRRLLPLPHNAARNERLQCLAKVLPNVRHFTRRSLLAMDNPVTCAIYGLAAASAIMQVWRLGMQAESDDAAVAPFAEWTMGWVALAFALIGTLAGALAMLRYRTRDPKEIHAREAAAYMDINYEFYGLNNDRAWAEFIRQQGGSGASHIVLARPEGRG